MRIEVNSADAANVRAGFAKLSAIAQGEALRGVAQVLYTDVQTAADRHTKTGALARSVDMTREADAWFIGHVNAPKYALFVHWGSKPHVIAPKKRRVLRWAGGGRFTFAKKVNHPGYPGDPYLVRASARIPQLFAAEVARRLASPT